MKVTLVFDFSETVKFLYLFYHSSSTHSIDINPLINKIVKNIEVLNKNNINPILTVKNEYKRYQNFIEYRLADSLIKINDSPTNYTSITIQYGSEDKIDGSLLLEDPSNMIKALMNRKCSIVLNELEY